MTKHEKMEFVIENWATMRVIELSVKLEVPPFTISQWARRLRKMGLDLPAKNASINWKALQAKYKNKEVV